MAFKFEDVNLTGWILVGVLIVCAAALFVIARNRQKWTTRMLANAAICMALSFLLSYIRLFKLPQGGSVGIGMLPIFIYCARWGFGPGMLASIVYSFLQLMFDGGFAIGWQSVLGDYIIAYSVLGLAGLFHKNKYGLLIGTAVGCAARFLVHYVVGATVWGEYMPDTFFGMTMTTPWFYSALYNGSYMLIDMIFCLLLGWLAYTLIGKYIRGEDIESLNK